MNLNDFDESLGTTDPLEPKGGVYTPGLAQLEAQGPDAGATNITHRSATKQYMLVGGVVMVGVAVLVFLRSQGVGADLVFGDEPKIDYPIDAPNNVNAEQRQRKVLSDLSVSEHLTQVPSDELEQNPFRLQSITATESDKGDAVAAGPAKPVGPTPEEVRLQELDRLALTLELGTVISGRISLARINGKTYRIGDIVAGEFAVTAINPDRTVEIKADNSTYVLEMSSK